MKSFIDRFGPFLCFLNFLSWGNIWHFNTFYLAKSGTLCVLTRNDLVRCPMRSDWCAPMPFLSFIIVRRLPDSFKFCGVWFFCMCYPTLTLLFTGRIRRKIIRRIVLHNVVLLPNCTSFFETLCTTVTVQYIQENDGVMMVESFKAKAIIVQYIAILR